MAQAEVREIRLSSMHPGQVELWNQRNRFNVVACGRRFGKTQFAIDSLAIPFLLEGASVGWFSSMNKFHDEAFERCRQKLAPITRSVDAQKYRIRLLNGSHIKFWSLERDDDAGRGQAYRLVIVDEAGLARNLEPAWTQAIRPTLTDYQGEAWFFGTPKGKNYFYRLFQRGLDPMEKFYSAFTRPTSSNPFIPAPEIEAARLELPNRAFRQEYLAEFLEDAGGVFTGVRDVIHSDLRQGSAASYMGVDLARTQDFTVITALDGDGVQVWFERFQQMSWTRQTERIGEVWQRLGRPVLTLDSTGVGDPVFDMLQTRGIAVTPFKFTAQSKKQLIDNLAIQIENQRVALLDDLVQTDELESYEYEQTPSGHVTTNAPPGGHDDCVIALALACWPRRTRNAPALRIIS